MTEIRLLAMDLHGRASEASFAFNSCLFFFGLNLVTEDNAPYLLPCILYLVWYLESVP